MSCSLRPPFRHSRGVPKQPFTALAVGTKCLLKAEAPRLLFTFPASALNSHSSYDIAPDDQRFVFIQEGWPTQINVVLNWFEELKRLVPTDN